MNDLLASHNRARTKIIATIGPACRKPEQIAELVRAGADLFRLNMAHASLKEHTENVASIRLVSRELNQPIAILIDLAGPKIRLGELPGGQIDCHRGDELRFVRGSEATLPGDVTTTYEPLVDELELGKLVMLADGAVSVRVEDKGKDFACCRIVQPGLIRSRQGLNLPGMKLSAPSMDEGDREHALWAAEMGIDFIGLSFVRRPEDVRELKELLRSKNSSARVIAKIEKQEALDQLEEIIDAAYGVMVARGDLGVEIDVARMPVVQKQIVAACQRRQKPVVIATQMLDSMQRSRRPTRAEVTDVANAILDGGDACMLSGETAIGDYPREAVEMMNQIALATEELYRDRPPVEAGNISAEGLHLVTDAVVRGASRIANKLGARLIVVASHSGAAALALSKQRNYVPTVGVSDSQATLGQMCLFWGVIPLPAAPTGGTLELLDYVTHWGGADGNLSPNDYIVLVAGTGLGMRAHNLVAVHQV